MSRLSFFLASLVWNLGLGMTWLVVPLYAASQGLSNAQIGVLFSLPVLVQAALNLLGGAYTDRVGGRRIMLASCWVMAIVSEGYSHVIARHCTSLHGAFQHPASSLCVANRVDNTELTQHLQVVLHGSAWYRGG